MFEYVFAVVDDRPIPPVEPPAGRPRYPWKQMDVGSSFFAPGRTPRSLAPSMSKAAKRLGTRYVAREEDDGVRVWRVA